MTKATLPPTSLNWACVYGGVVSFERKTAEELIDSGLVRAEELAPESRKARGYGLRITKTRDGLYNLRMLATEHMARDRAYQAFRACLLAGSGLPSV